MKNTTRAAMFAEGAITASAIALSVGNQKKKGAKETRKTRGKKKHR